MNKRTETALWIGLVCTVAFTAFVGGLLVQLMAEPSPYLPPCPTEDSINCIWDATTHGDTGGSSFIDLDGQTFYLED